MSSLHMITGCANRGAKPVLRSTATPQVYKWEELAEDTSSKRILRNWRELPFPSLWISSHQLPTTTPRTLGLLVGREADSLCPGWMFASVQKYTACLVGGGVRLGHRSLADIAAQWQSKAREGMGYISELDAVDVWVNSIDQMDTTEGSEVWEIPKDLHPNRLPVQGLRDTPVIDHWKTRAQDHEWLYRSHTALIQ